MLFLWPHTRGCVFGLQVAAMATLIACSLGGCVETGRMDRAATGLKVTASEKGTLAFVATARASQKAIDRGSLAMKRSTCLEGARLLIAHGLKERGLTENNLRGEGSNFLANSEYCQTFATYFPAGIPATERKVGP